MISGIFVIISVLFFSGAISYIPLVVTSAYSCYNNFKRLIFIKEDYKVLKNFQIDLNLYLFCFLACLFLGLQYGLLLSILISFLFVFKRNSKPTWNFDHLMSEDLHWTSSISSDDRKIYKALYFNLNY